MSSLDRASVALLAIVALFALLVRLALNNEQTARSPGRQVASSSSAQVVQAQPPPPSPGTVAQPLELSPEQPYLRYALSPGQSSPVLAVPRTPSLPQVVSFGPPTSYNGVAYWWTAWISACVDIVVNNTIEVPNCPNVEIDLHKLVGGPGSAKTMQFRAQDLPVYLELYFYWTYSIANLIPAAPEIQKTLIPGQLFYPQSERGSPLPRSLSWEAREGCVVAWIDEDRRPETPGRRVRVCAGDPPATAPPHVVDRRQGTLAFGAESRASIVKVNTRY